MDIISLHKESVERYKRYIQSFIDVQDEDIREEVTRQLESGKLWPEPLIQFNPARNANSRDDIDFVTGQMPTVFSENRPIFDIPSREVRRNAHADWSNKVKI